VDATLDALFACPVCHGPLTSGSEGYACDPCGHAYPIINGIADFRLETDPFIPIDVDRAKARHLAELSKTRSFEELVRSTTRSRPKIRRIWPIAGRPITSRRSASAPRCSRRRDWSLVPMATRACSILGVRQARW